MRGQKLKLLDIIKIDVAVMNEPCFLLAPEIK